MYERKQGLTPAREMNCVQKNSPEPRRVCPCFRGRRVNTRKKGTDHPKAAIDCVSIAVFERFWVVSPFFTPISFFISYPARQ